jgi:hypothetical protein
MKNNTKGTRTVYIKNRKTGVVYGPFRIKDVINKAAGKYTSGKQLSKRGRKMGWRKRRNNRVNQWTKYFKIKPEQTIRAN